MHKLLEVGIEFERVEELQHSLVAELILIL